MSKKQINNRLNKLFDDIKEEERALDPQAPAPIPIGKDVVKEAEGPLETPVSAPIPLDTDKTKEEKKKLETLDVDPTPHRTEDSKDDKEDALDNSASEPILPDTDKLKALETPVPEPTALGTRILPPLDAILAARSQGAQAASSLVQVANATMSLPVNLGAESWATLQIVDSNTNRQWGGEEQLLVQQVTDQLSQALENARLFQRIQLAASEMSMLFDVSRDFSSASVDIKNICSVVAEKFVTEMSFPEASVSLLEPDGNTLKVITNTYLDAETGELVSDDQIGELESLNKYPATAQVLEINTPLVVHASDPDADPAELAYMGSIDPPVQTLIMLPLSVQRKPIGVIELESQDNEMHISDAQINLAMTLANQAAIALDNALSYERVQKSASEMATLFDVSQEFSSASVDINEIGPVVAQSFVDVMSVPAASISLLDPDGKTLRVITNVYFDDAQRELFRDDEVGQTESLEDYPATARVLETMQPLVVHVSDPDSDPSELAYMQSHKNSIQTLIILPLVVKGRAIGVIELESWDNEIRMSEEELNLAMTIANQAAVAFDNARSYERIQKSADEMATVFDVSQAISNAPVEVEGIARIVARNFMNVIGIPECSICLYDPGDNSSQVVMDLIVDKNGRQQIRKEEIGKIYDMKDFPDTSQALRDFQPLVTHASDPDADPNELALMKEYDVTTSIVLPLVVKGQAIGYIELESSGEEHHYSKGDLNLAMTLANQAAVSIENARSYELIQQAAHEMSLLFEASQTINSEALEIEDIARAVAYQFINTMPKFSLAEILPEVEVALIDYDQKTLVKIIGVLMEDDGETITEDTAKDIFPYEDYPATLGAIETLEPLIVHISDPDADPAELAYMKEHDLATSVTLPLAVKGRVIGTIDLNSYQKELHFTQEDINLAMTLANQAAVAIENARLFENTQKRLREQTIIREATEILSSTLEYEAILTQLTKLLCEAIDATTASILEIDDKLNTYTVTAEYISPDAGGGENQSDLGETYSIADYGDEEIVLLERLRQGQHYVNHIDDPQIGEKKQKEMEQYGAKSILDIPLKSRGELIGFVEIYESRHKREFTDAEINLCVLLSQQAANAIENARLYEETQESEKSLQRQNDYMAAAAEVGRLVTSTLDMDILFRRAVYLLREHFGYYHAAIFTIEEAGFEVVIREATGDAGKEMKERGHSLQVGSKSVVGTATDTGKPFIVNNVTDNPNHQPNPLLPETKAEAAIPLIIGRRIIGALDLQSTDVDAFTPEDVIVLQLLADQFATAIDNARSYKLAQDSFTEMRELERLKSQFLANMSHELRTPLNSIIGFSRIIIKGIDGPVTDLQQQDLTAIYNSGQHLLGLINDILDLSKIEAGKMELTFDEIDVEKLIKSVMSTVVGLIKDKSVRLEEEIQNDLPAVKADSMRVRQILINLFSNAVKFTDEGVIKVAAESEGDFVRISVIDSGPGISKEDQKKLFQAFSQVDASATRATGGSGLGLSISQELVHMHGGEIGLESEVGKGSTFYFTLPLHGAQEIVPEIEIADTQDDAHALVVLAIDDDEKVIHLYQRYLNAQGYQVIALTDPKKAVESAKEIKPYAITLDIMMPNYDGWQVLQDLKSDPETQNIPILVCSIVEDTDKGYALGATDYLLKPIIEDDLLGALDRLNNDGTLHDILIIDDDPDDRRLLEKLLSSAKGFTPILAEDGPAGWDMIVSHPPDAVILDLFMPKMDGFEIIDAMQAKAELRDIPVIVISGGDINTIQQEKLDSLNHHLIQKGTLDPKELLSALERSLNHFKKKE